LTDLEYLSSRYSAVALVMQSKQRFGYVWLSCSASHEAAKLYCQLAWLRTRQQPTDFHLPRCSCLSTCSKVFKKKPTFMISVVSHKTVLETD
jgi:hypothetical protein